jgi:hypothetical protein
MNKDESQALIKYEPKPLALLERLELYAEKKKQEFEEALERGRVSDPITGSVILTSLIVSAATTAATTILTTLLTPRQKIVEERGRRTGELVINSELGVLIPEVYFGMLSDGYGGSWVPAIVGWTSGIRKHVSTTTQQSGGGKFGGGGTTTETRTTTYDLDWLLLLANKGPYRVLRSKANSDVIFDLYGQVSSYEGESASSYTTPYQIVAYDNASGGNEVTLQNGGGGNGGSVQWNNVKSNGAATRQLSIYYRTSAGGTFPIELTINGGAPQSINLAPTNEVYLAHTVAVSLNDGDNTVKIQNKSSTYNVGIDKIYAFPGHTTGTTGVLDPAIGADTTYDPELPPDPTTDYDVPFDRWNGLPDREPTGGDTGTINHGGNAQFAIYPGNTTQLPDPTYEAAIDAQYGAGSTPAYRGRCYEVDSAFYLTRWGGVIPNRIALLEHDTIKNLAQMCAFMCSRVGIDSGDYDFSALETITPRGLRIMGSKFEAREPMQSAEIPFDVIYAEQEGILVGKPKYPFTSVATLTDKDFAWSDDEETQDGPLTLIDAIEPNETDLVRRVDVKYVDLDRDGEPGLQGYGRQITVGEDSATLDLQWTLTREEAQALAQKEVYRRYTEKPCKYVLSWEHLWINVGSIFTATLSDGFTYTILHAKDSGGIGIRECEGIILDEPLFDQSAVVDPYSYEKPVVPIPAMTVALFLDTPLLRDGDETTNNGVGFYMVGTPRTNVGQSWPGFALDIERNNEWYQLSESNLPGTMGTIVSASDLYPDPEVIDIVFTADSTTDLLTSISNQLVNGNEVTVGNTGGALPAPLVAGTPYFVRDKSSDTFKLAATLGGTAINLTSNGTGTNFINLGKIVVDLYNTTQSLSSVTKADVLNGANPGLAGDMVFRFGTATKLGGYPNRWQLTTLLNGLRDTEDRVADSFTGKRFVFLDAAVRFVPLLIEDLNIENNYRAVTSGQSLDDAAIVPFTWTGNTWRPRKVSDITGGKDGSGDWFTQFTGHPKPDEEPAQYAVGVWTSGFVTLKRTLPATTGTNHGVQLLVAEESWEGNWPGSYTTGTFNKNNVVGNVTAMTVEPLVETFSRFDFTFQNPSTVELVDQANAWAHDFGNPMLALETRTNTTAPFVPTLVNAPISIEWTEGTQPGTALETYKSFGVIVWTRDNVDIGRAGPILYGQTTYIRLGPRYTFLLSGTEYRVYVNFNPNQGQKPILILAGTGTFPFPLRLTVKTNDFFSVRNITAGGALLPSTIYAGRQQLADFGSLQSSLNLEIYQKGKSPQPDGIPVRITLP